MDNEFKPADGVTIDNAIRYVEAVEQAVKRDIRRLPKNERSFILGMMAGALRLASDSLATFRKSLEDQGASSPMSDDQKLQLRLLLRDVLNNSTPRS